MQPDHSRPYEELEPAMLELLEQYLPRTTAVPMTGPISRSRARGSGVRPNAAASRSTIMT